MIVLKTRSILLFSKKNLLNTLFLIFFFKHITLNKWVGYTNNVISLKSPFHYKLVKNSLGIKQIKLTLVNLGFQKKKPNLKLFGTTQSFETLEKKKIKI